MCHAHIVNVCVCVQVHALTIVNSDKVRQVMQRADDALEKAQDGDIRSSQKKGAPNEDLQKLLLAEMKKLLVTTKDSDLQDTVRRQLEVALDVDKCNRDMSRAEPRNTKKRKGRKQVHTQHPQYSQKKHNIPNIPICLPDCLCLAICLSVPICHVYLSVFLAVYLSVVS